MATKIRLAQRGRKAFKLYDIVVADTRAPRDGRFIEKLGTYNPNTHPISVTLNEESAFDWLMKGAQPTDTARMILSNHGLMYKRHLQIGVDKGAVKQEDADKKIEAWKAEKAKQTQALLDKISKEQEANKKARLEAEAKVAQDRLTGAKQKVEAAAEAEAPAAEAEGGEEAVAEQAAPVEEAPVEEAKEEPAKEEKQEEEAKADESVDDASKDA